MADDPDILILDHLCAIRKDVDDLKGMRHEIREGFATLRAHNAASHGDYALLGDPVLSLGSDIGRIKRRLDLADDRE